MRILFYGDSNTWGYDAKTGRRLDKRFTRILMEKRNDEIIESGLNGRTICFDDPCVPGRNALKDVCSVLRTHTPLDIMFINLGANDAKRIFCSNETMIETGMIALCQKILSPGVFKHGYSVPKIILVQPARMHPDYIYNPDTVLTFGKEGYEMIEKAGFRIQRVAAFLGLDYLPTPGLVAGSYDGIHLDEAGHALLADCIMKKLEEY